jgi:hypothetical protein
VGLFGYTKNATTIKNLGVKITDKGVKGNGNVGGLVGYKTGSMENCSATGDVISGKGSYVGGLVGYQYNFGTRSLSDIRTKSSIFSLFYFFQFGNIIIYGYINAFYIYLMPISP